MDLKANLLLNKMPKDTDLHEVGRLLQGYVNKWLNFDQHPQDAIIEVGRGTYPNDIRVSVTSVAAEVARLIERPKGPLYCISDLHMGDQGPRDNFNGREKQLMSLLDMVESNGGRLIICGDLFELWQSNISKVITKRLWLLDRLAKMGAIYVLGNHDADLLHFIGPQWLAKAHPLFKMMRTEHRETIGGKDFIFVHGHAADPYCAGDTPGLGRITAIYSGLAEDKNGGPMLDKYRTVEQKVVGRLEKLVSLWGRLRGRPDRNTEINRKLRDLYIPMFSPQRQVVVCGHTHFPGRIGQWHYNCGTWAERVNSFVKIYPEGLVSVLDWADQRAEVNFTQLPY